MKIIGVRHIDGPNVYLYKPILMARIDLESYSERESYEYAGFADRLLRLFPGLREHHCAKGEPGGFVERLYGGTYFGHIVEHVAIEMACLAGLDVHYGKTLYAGDVGQYNIVMECKFYACQRDLLLMAVDVVDALAGGRSYDVFAGIEKVVARHRHARLGPSTQAVVDAALARGIPVRRLSDGSLVQLGYGEKRKLVSATVTSETSAVAVDIACDKALTKKLLQDAGIAVPEGGVAGSMEEAVEWFRSIGTSVVLKPWNGNQGRGVSLNLQSEAQVRAAYRIASQFAEQVIVEECIEGSNLRLLVVGGKFVAASLRLPAQVRGDGTSTILELIERENQNPNRGVGHEKSLTMLTVDEVVEETLAKQRLRLNDIPGPGVVVLLRESANLSTGGQAVDVTDEIDESYQRLAERIARIIGLDVCGIDLVLRQPDAPYYPEGARVIEVNAAPGIRMHEQPSSGSSRPVGQHIVDMLFPAGENGRIPIVAITGTNGKTTTTRMIGHTLSSAGRKVGMTTTGGVYIDGKLVMAGDTTGPDSARMVLSDPLVDTAVLETARGGIVRGGLAYDKANVAVLTNISVDHVGQDGIETLEDLVHIKSLVAECVHDDGIVVLNADDLQLVELAKRLKPRVVYFAESEDNKALMRHLARGGMGYYVSRGWIVEAKGQLTWEIAPVQDIPVTMAGTATFHVENCLAAVAALRGLGLTRQQVAKGISSFNPLTNNRGRTMMFELPNDVRVVLDYAHNPDGFSQIGRWLSACPHGRLIGVVGVPGDRADQVVRLSSERLAEHFDAFVVKEDVDKRGREPGVVADLMARHIQSLVPHKPLTIVLDETDALTQAIALAEPGDIVVTFYEKLDPLLTVVQSVGGSPTSQFSDRIRNSIFAVLS